MGKIRIGTSGWRYDEWRAGFFPDELSKDDELAWISRRFDTLEIDRTFYGLPDPETCRRWAEDTPSRFVFAIKASRYITHMKRLKDPRAGVANFLASGILRLGPKLGPILWQLPERMRFDADRLRGFLEILPHDTRGAARQARDHDPGVVEDAWTSSDANHRLRHAFEPRHASFFVPECVRLLRDHGVALVVSDAADWHRCDEVTAGWVYIRLHGARETYVSAYGDRALDRWAERIRRWSRAEEPDDARRVTDRPPPRRESRDVYVYFDNTARGHAPRDALALARRLGLTEDQSAG